VIVKKKEIPFFKGMTIKGSIDTEINSA